MIFDDKEYLSGTCQLWWQSSRCRVSQIRPTATSSPAALQHRAIWGEVVYPVWRWSSRCSSTHPGWSFHRRWSPRRAPRPTGRLETECWIAAVGRRSWTMTRARFCMRHRDLRECWHLATTTWTVRPGSTRQIRCNNTNNNINGQYISTSDSCESSGQPASHTMFCTRGQNDQRFSSCSIVTELQVWSWNFCSQSLAYKFVDFTSLQLDLSPSIDTIWAVMIVWRLGGKIIRTVLCCVVYDSCAHQWHAHAVQFLNLRVGLGLDFVFVYLYRLCIVEKRHALQAVGLLSYSAHFSQNSY